MKEVLKQLSSFILPVTVLILVPFSIENNLSVRSLPALVAGVGFMGIGLSVMILTIASFKRIGKGTLAPWSPTKKLVVSGMHAYVRNPMIMGVLAVLIGESAAVLSLNIFLWAIVFFIINTVYFILYEEPDLERKFGDEYREYRKHVRRWIPALKPFKPGAAQQ